MTVRHPGISPTNDLVAKKIFSNPEITCQFIRDMLDLPTKNVTILEGSNIHVLPSLPYSVQDFYTSIDVLAELDNGTQVIIEIQVHHQNFFINRLWAYLHKQWTRKPSSQDGVLGTKKIQRNQQRRGSQAVVGVFREQTLYSTT